MYRLLIVDDEEIIRNGIMKALESLNTFELFGAADGIAALEIISREQIDAVILDVVMPRMDGIEFLKRIREHGADPLVYVLSGHSDFDYARSMLRYGVADYLLKPIDRSDTLELGEAILRKLEERSRRREQEEQLRAKADLLLGLTETEKKDSFLFNQQLEKLSQQVVTSAAKDLTQSVKLLEEGFSRIEEKPDRYKSVYKKQFATLIVSTLIRFCPGRAGGEQDVILSELVDSFQDDQKLKQWLLCEITQFVRIGNSAGQDYYYLSAKEYIDRNYTGDISVQELADMLWVSPNYLGRIFREKQGEGITDYLRNKRLDYAAKLLRDGAIRIEWVAQACGIPDQRYFSRVFKERFGMSPRAYNRTFKKF